MTLKGSRTRRGRVCLAAAAAGRRLLPVWPSFFFPFFVPFRTHIPSLAVPLSFPRSLPLTLSSSVPFVRRVDTACPCHPHSPHPAYSVRNPLPSLPLDYPATPTSGVGAYPSVLSAPSVLRAPALPPAGTAPGRHCPPRGGRAFCLSSARGPRVPEAGWGVPGSRRRPLPPDALLAPDSWRT